MSLEHKLLETFILAGEQVGADGTGKDGIVGFLLEAAESNPNGLVELLVGSLPYQNPCPEDPSRDQFKASKEEVDPRLRR